MNLEKYGFIQEMVEENNLQINNIYFCQESSKCSIIYKIQEIEKAVNLGSTNVEKHIKKAIEHFSDRQNPDYRNSIKESISAVEAICRNITKATSPSTRSSPPQSKCTTVVWH